MLFLLSWLHIASGVLCGFGYVALIALWADRLERRSRQNAVITALTNTGERSLSGYLAQSVVFVILLPAWTVGLGATLSTAQAEPWDARNMTGQHGAIAPLSRLDWLWVVLPYVLRRPARRRRRLRRSDRRQAHANRATRCGAGAVAYLVGDNAPQVVGNPAGANGRVFPGTGGDGTLAHGIEFFVFPVYLVSYPMAFVALPGRWA